MHTRQYTFCKTFGEREHGLEHGNIRMSCEPDGEPLV